MSNEFFRKTTGETVTILGTDIERGLLADIAAQRLLEQGSNQARGGRKGLATAALSQTIQESPADYPHDAGSRIRADTR